MIYIRDSVYYYLLVNQNQFYLFNVDISVIIETILRVGGTIYILIRSSNH